MAISEACQLWIEQRIEEELPNSNPHAIGILLAKELKEVFNAKMKASTLKKRAQRIQKRNGTNVPLPKATKKQTKPTIKLQLKETAKAIKREKIADDDLKVVGDALADKIAKGEAASRVGTRVATAVKKSQKKGVKKEPKQPDNFERLKKHCLSFTEGLNFWADNTIQPTTEDEAIAAKTILSAAPSIIKHYSRLGIDILAIYDKFIDPDRREQNETGRKTITLQFHRRTDKLFS